MHIILSKLTFKALLVSGLMASGIVFSNSAHAISLGRDALTSFVTPRSQTLLISATMQAQGDRAQKFISDMGQKALSFLSNPALSQVQKEKKFKKLLIRHFDMSTIGRFALGKNWRRATESQKEEYQRLFQNMVVRVYAGRFNGYKGEAFNVVSFQNSGKKDILVTSYIVPNSGSKVQVDWRVRNKGGQYKIIDVVIEGVSMSLTQRSDFSSVIQRGGGNFEVLLSHLRK
jgi:phospholipid transport system substrate-binding protein